MAVHARWLPVLSAPTKKKSSAKNMDALKLNVIFMAVMARNFCRTDKRKVQTPITTMKE